MAKLPPGSLATTWHHSAGKKELPATAATTAQLQNSAVLRAFQLQRMLKVNLEFGKAASGDATTLDLRHKHVPVLVQC